MYTGPFKVCSLDEKPFQRAKEFHGSVAALACALVHESVHGHLYRKRILQNRRNYSRIEDICNREMLRFARRISFDTAGWVTEAGRQPMPLVKGLKFAFQRTKQYLREERK